MSIKISEQVVDVFGGGSVSIPFADVKGKEGLISVGFRLLYKVFEVTGEVCD